MTASGTRYVLLMGSTEALRVEPGSRVCMSSRSEATVPLRIDVLTLDGNGWSVEHVLADDVVVALDHVDKHPCTATRRAYQKLTWRSPLSVSREIAIVARYDGPRTIQPDRAVAGAAGYLTAVVGPPPKFVSVVALRGAA